MENKCRQYEKKLSELNIVNRWKVGEYLHDYLAQKLNYAKILVHLLKKDEKKAELSARCSEVLNLIDEGIQEVRDLSHDIIPVIGKEEQLPLFTTLSELTPCVILREAAKRPNRSVFLLGWWGSSIRYARWE